MSLVVEVNREIIIIPGAIKMYIIEPGNAFVNFYAFANRLAAKLVNAADVANTKNT